MSTPLDPEDRPGHGEEDGDASTERERSFTSAPRRGERPRPLGRSFRILTLLAGLALFLVVVLLLLR